MCGICGIIDYASAEEAKRKALGRMCACLKHRGPDDEGFYVKAEVGLGHRRLKVIDLSAAGSQPMVSASGRYVVIFNGEIYNHLELRQELPGVAWRGHADTETLLAAFESWGIEQALKRTVGMFAIALWDNQARVLTLARDRIGEKPLYYGFGKNLFIFGSELKAIKAHPDFTAEINRDVLYLYLRYCYIPAPYSIYKGINKLPAGSYIQFPVARGLDNLRSARPVEYWNLAEVARQGIARPFRGGESEAIAALDKQLKQAIDLQMIADVPLGAFLSGGVDSSTVVALMQAQSARPVKTFSIGFKEDSYNEAGYAKAVAGHLGTEHTECYVSSQEAMQVIPRLGSIYNEPFADSSQIPTFLVSQIARKQVTVSLSGDGGDELFCGYNRYLLADAWRKISILPFGARRLAGSLIKKIPLSAWRGIFRQANRFIRLPSNMEEKLEKLSTRLENVNGIEALYASLVSGISHLGQAVIGAKEPATWLMEKGIKLEFPDPKLQMMYLDAMTYLPDDILVKLDRAAMFHSLETRVPFLDHRVIELAWSLPLSMKMRRGQTKWILRQLLYKYVPKKLIERPKMGFGIPVGEWIRKELKGWAEGLLEESRLQQEGFFDVQFVRSRWQEHISGKRDWQHFLWTVLMFQTWREEQKSGVGIN
jgi:asparagine synthase (glutamine-hydrolysing)